MSSTPPPTQYRIPSIPRLPSQSSVDTNSRTRSSIGSSFSFGPQPLVNSLLDATSNPNPSSTRTYSNYSYSSSSFALDPNRSVLPASPLRSSPRVSSRSHSRSRRARARGRGTGREGSTNITSRHPHPLANDTTDVFQDSDVDENGDNDSDEEDEDGSEYEWGMVDRMRLWRHDALMQHLYATAAFWGDKILSWTNDPNDAFWLAQTFFMTHQYSRAERLLTRPFSTTITNTSPSSSSLNPKHASAPASPALPNGHSHSHLHGHGHLLSNLSSTSTTTTTANPNTKGKGKELPPPPIIPSSSTPTSASGPVVPRRLPMGPGGMIEIPEDMQQEGSGGGVSRLVDMSVACRYLAAQCQVRQGNWAEATEMLGEANPFRNSGRSGPAIPNVDGGIKVEASMCHLRGLLMLKLNRGDQAKHCFMEALALDVKCYDAFEQLVSGEMMTPDEEWEFVQSLSYTSQTPEDADFVQLIYTARLRKYKHRNEHLLTRRRLAEEFALRDNPDVLFAFADALYAQFRWADCWVVTERILGLVQVHGPTMPLHVACMYHLSHLHSKLFMLAHELVDREPENPVSWYTVGVWYLASGKWSQARQYFSKTSLMDPRFGPAWIAFAHTFALEGEHDHAVTAYSTCARMFTGSHLPLMFVGMEHIMLSNHVLADEALNASNQICDGDPLLINERGVMAFNHGDYERAAALFQESLDLAQVTQSSQKSWSTTYLNLGTCYRKLKRFEEAKIQYQRVLEIDHRHPQALAFLGMVYHLLDETDKAIVKYHEALSVDPINGHVIELLNLALESDIVKEPIGKIDFAAGGEAFKKMMNTLRVKYVQLLSQEEMGEAGKVGTGKERVNLGADDEMSIG